MERETILNEVMVIIRGIFQDENLSIGLKDNLYVYGMNSMMVVELIVRMEEAFEVMIPDQYLDGSKFTTIEEIANVIQEIV